VRLPLALSLALAALAPALARAQSAPAGGAGGAGGPVGLTVTVDLGGGGSIGSGSYGIFEGELGAGWELGHGLRPEAAVILGIAPDAYTGLRAGVHWAPRDVPLYGRAALDWSTARHGGAFRWLLLGGGGEVRLTDVLGGFAEADLGIPISSNTGVGLLVRAGVSFRL
jgi:hypothetical protein